MKLKFAIGLFALITLSARGQQAEDIFVRSVKEFPWTSDDALDAERIATWKKIPLTILRIAKDSLKVSRTIGTFKDSLTITRYEAQLKRETILAKCKYDWRGDEGFLHLLMNDTDNLKYRFTLVSTGSFILLTRKSGKKVMQKL